MGKITYKTCPSCGKTFRLNRNFFKRNSDETFHDLCKECDNTNKLNKEWKNGKLLCHSCLEYKEIDEFTPNGSKTEMRKYRRYICNKCECNRNNENLKKLSDNEKFHKCLMMKFYNARDRAKSKNLEFNLTYEFIEQLWFEQNGKCALSNLPMTYLLGEGRVPTNVSIDKIDKNKGYIKENVQLVCNAVNQIKSDLNEDEMILFCESIIKNISKIKKDN